MFKRSGRLVFSLLIIGKYYTPKIILLPILLKWRILFNCCSLVYLENYTKLRRKAAFSSCITNYHINTVIKHRLLKGPMAWQIKMPLTSYRGVTNITSSIPARG